MNHLLIELGTCGLAVWFGILILINRRKISRLEAELLPQTDDASWKAAESAYVTSYRERLEEALEKTPIGATNMCLRFNKSKGCAEIYFPNGLPLAWIVAQGECGLPDTAVIISFFLPESLKDALIEVFSMTLAPCGDRDPIAREARQDRLRVKFQDPAAAN